jgi:hypothetical protein
VLIDDNNVTIAGHPQEYMPGYDLSRTLSGYGLTTETTMGEDLNALHIDLCRVFRDSMPHALVIKRLMAPGIQGAEGSPSAHEVLKTATAIQYLESRGGYDRAIEMLKAATPERSPLTFKGSSGVGKNRDDFGKIINGILDGMTEAQRLESVRVFDNTRRFSCAAASWSAATFRRRPGSARPPASRVSMARSARFWRCASAKSPWPV